jgi:hypothetical protein
MRSTFPSPFEVPCKSWSSANRDHGFSWVMLHGLLLSQLYEGDFASERTPNKSVQCLVQQFIQSPILSSMVRSTSIHFLHRHRESSLSSNYYSQPLGSISTHATTPSNTFQNGAAYPTDPLYNFLALHLILELSAFE